MNSDCIAVAADSAATLTEKKIYTANKIFTLSKFHPVGIMFYGSSSITSVPAETLVKEYRKRLGDHYFETLEEYGMSFLNFLNTGCPSIEDSYESIIPDESKNVAIMNLFERLLWIIETKVKNAVLESLKAGNEPDRVTIENYFNEIIEEQLKDVSKSIPRGSRLKVRKVTKILNDIIDDREWAHDYKPILLPLTAKIISASKKLFANMIASEKHLPFMYTGIVIMGFGENECYPSCMEYIVDSCIIDNEIKVEKKETRKIGPNSRSFVEVFAQKDVAKTFLEGASPKLVGGITKTFEEVLNDATMIVAAKLIEKKEISEEDIKRNNVKLMETLLENIKSHQKKFIDPIKDAVAFLPKDEMAQMAESLVNITSLRLRVSRESETVGGPIDVAVISKGDGFIWIKRKHYFNLESNPHFVEKYYDVGD